MHRNVMDLAEHPRSLANTEKAELRSATQAGLFCLFGPRDRARDCMAITAPLSGIPGSWSMLFS